MAIHIITGRPGSGKTYVLAKKAKQFLEKGYTVHSNFWLNSPSKKLFYYDNPKDLEKVSQGIILMDEAQVYFNSRKWSSLNEKLQYKLQQHRKDGLDIWGTVQHEARIDTIFRELVSVFYKCTKVIGSSESAKNIWGLIRVAQYYPEDLKRDNKNEISSEWVFLRRHICDFYDTLRKIDIPSSENVISIMYERCPTCGHMKKLG